MIPFRPNQSADQVVASGVVLHLWRYPVKSMLGEQLEHLDLDKRGVQGDRLYAIRTAEGKFGSGKGTRRFRYIDGLFGFGASYDDDLPVLSFPNGQIIIGDNPEIHGLLSKALGQPVALAKEGIISHFDAGP